jgi:hypothetical protein
MALVVAGVNVAVSVSVKVSISSGTDDRTTTTTTTATILGVLDTFWAVAGFLPLFLWHLASFELIVHLGC